MKELNFKIEELKSFQELTDKDQLHTYQSFLREELEERNVEHKYLKRTAQIMKRGNDEFLFNECYMIFDEYMLTEKYSSLVFSLCGITHHFHFVLYINVMDTTKVEDRAQFVANILGNLLAVEVPKLKRFPLKFIMSRDNELANQALDIFANSKKTSHLFNAFLFVREPRDVQEAQLTDPYTQEAFAEIMHSTISETNIRELFNRHLDKAAIKENYPLQRFVSDYHMLARDLLGSKETINLRFCTMERTDDFQDIVQENLKHFGEGIMSRIFLFDLLRAIMIIFNY
ncbi:uncharacterized protein LOC115632737 [Scaptodrosophila lebanonensis]|uniref:Uncharacterized protein LOC115632737 n=1 Tax=Drosophila lebanonensis TaxID=7225 RepID=A0A6J2UEK0_DROLE|nr:uncharacterized protein LOC115632737 [Scaptodrosophila lebanonensis]